jgi:hypothetical protein
MESASKAAKAASDKVAALERWEGEGGAQLPVRQEVGSLSERERHILECLGGAVVSVWSELPTVVQRAIFEAAASQAAYDVTRLREQIARFLHNHKTRRHQDAASRVYRRRTRRGFRNLLLRRSPRSEAACGFTLSSD